MATARLIISTPSDFFRHAQKNPAIPELSGEIPSSWPNIVSSLAHLWPQIIPATSTLLAAEKFAAINYALGYADYPQREFDFLWKKLIESMDHNHDGQGGAIGDNRKIGYMQLALLQGGEILRDRLRNIAERVQVLITNSFPIVVFNPLGWVRDDVVKTHVTLYGEVSPADIAPFKKGMRLLDPAGHSVPFHLVEYSENISRALELVFVARGVPSLGYKTFYLVAAEKPDIPITQRLTLYANLKRLEIENSVEWKTPRPIRLSQLFPFTASNPAIHYGIPFGANAADNILPKTGPHAIDEIPAEDWKRSRHIHDWIHAGTADWGLTIASDHQQIRLDEDKIRAEMLRGTRSTSVKVVRGDEITSLYYPPPGTYVFRYSLTSGQGDWKSSKAYRAGMNWNNPLLPVSVVDAISRKSPPPTQSFCSIQQENLIVSTLKKSDLSSSILLRVYEIEGLAAETPVEFSGRTATFSEVNLLEEDLDSGQGQSLRSGPYAIKTLKLNLSPR